MAVDDTILITADWTNLNGGSPPEVDDVLWSDGGGGSAVDPIFNIDSITDNGGDNYTYTTTQLTSGDLPVIYDYLFDELDLSWYLTLTKNAEKVPTGASNVIIYKRLVVAGNNQIWFEDI